MEQIVEYFNETTGFTAIPEQEDLLKTLIDDSVEKMLCSAGRGFSKTLCCAIVILWYAEKSLETGVPIKIMMVSPQDTMYEFVNRYISQRPLLKENLIKKGIFTEIPVEGFQLRKAGTEKEIFTEVFTKPATGKVRSHRCDLLILDESADIDREIINSASMCLTGNQPNRIILISTPHKTGFFTTLAINPEKYGYVLKSWSSEVCPWMIKTSERAKTMLSPAEYAIDVLGRPPTKEEETRFSKKHLDQCIKPSISLEGGVNSRIEIGIDWGFSPCKTVLTVIERKVSRVRVLRQKAWHKTPIEEYAEELVALIKSYPDAIIKADSKPPEYPEYLKAHYPNVKIFYLDGLFHKDSELEQLARHVNQHTLEISREQGDLITQLNLYRKGMRTGDLCDSLAIACYEAPNLKKKVVRIVF